MGKVITISREFGSGGRTIGKALAEQLGIHFYDKDLILKTAEETGLSQKYIEQQGEHSPLKNIFAYAFVGRDSTGASMDDYVFQAQRKIILELAEQEDCVIVGRCADFILKDKADAIHIFLHGEKEEKCKRICELYGKSQEESYKLLKEMDKKRAINYKYCTDAEWGRARNYTMSLNTSVLGYEQCVELIAQIYKTHNKMDS